MSTSQFMLLDAIRLAWVHHPEWSLGRLLGSAASIARAELRVNPVYVRDEEIQMGLRALLPEDWEEDK